MDRRTFVVGASSLGVCYQGQAASAAAPLLLRALYWVARRVATRYPSKALVQAAVGSSSRAIGRGTLTATKNGLAVVVGTDIAVGISRHIFNSAFDAAFQRRYYEWFDGKFAPDRSSGLALIPDDANVATFDKDFRPLTEYSTFGSHHRIQTEQSRRFRYKFIDVFLYDLDLKSASYVIGDHASEAQLAAGSLKLDFIGRRKPGLGAGRKSLVNVIDHQVVGVSEPFIIA